MNPTDLPTCLTELRPSCCPTDLHICPTHLPTYSIDLPTNPTDLPTCPTVLQTYLLVLPGVLLIIAISSKTKPTHTKTTFFENQSLPPSLPLSQPSPSPHVASALWLLDSCFSGERVPEESYCCLQLQSCPLPLTPPLVSRRGGGWGLRKRKWGRSRLERGCVWTVGRKRILFGSSRKVGGADTIVCLP